MRVSVQLVPEAGTPPRGSAAVVVDVLRATTTLTVACANGAARVIPLVTPERAFAARDAQPQGLLCGERDGRRIAGFDLGNSPEEYPPETVRGRTLLFASTNGSLAILQARSARRCLLGCFANGTAVVESLVGEQRVLALCAGQLGRFSLEDAAFAGWLCERLAAAGASIEGAAARLARSIAPRDRFEVRALVEGSSHGRYLKSLGGPFARDVGFAGELDRLDRAYEIAGGGAVTVAGPARS